MTTHTLADTLLDTEGQPVANGLVIATLVDSENAAVTGYIADGVIVQARSVRTGADGGFSLDLPANAEITPANTYYRMKVAGRPAVLIEANDDGNIEDLLVDDLLELGPTALAGHLADTTDAHDASAISFTPTGTLAATDVQAAIVEAAAEAAAAAEPIAAAHIIDATDAHDASAVSFAPAGTVAATDVQGAVAEVATDAAAALTVHEADTTAIHGIADTATLETTTGAQAKVDAAITALLAGAPGALDTLNELAAALGDDANFATTVTNALAGKQPLDADLTAIAGLATTAFGRAFLTETDATSTRATLGLGSAALAAAAAFDVAGSASAAQAAAIAASVLRDPATHGNLITGALASTVVLQFSVSGDAQPRMVDHADGKRKWGDGTNALDTDLYRYNGTLRTGNVFYADGGVVSISGGMAAGAGQAIQGDYFMDRSGLGPYFLTSGSTWTLANRTTTTNVPLTVKGMASQSGDLQQWQDSAGTVVAKVQSNGSLATSYIEDLTLVGPYLDTTSATSIKVINRVTTTNVPLTVKGMASQSGDLQQWQNSAGTVLARVNSSGILQTSDGTSLLSIASTVGLGGSVISHTSSGNFWLNSDAGVILTSASGSAIQLRAEGVYPPPISLLSTAATFGEATNIAFGTTTGTKIGTATSQKIGLWNATPVVQPAAVADATGGSVIDVEARAALNALLARCRAFGSIAT